MERIICVTLDELEAQESVLLTWGNTQGFFSQTELSKIITQVLQSYPLASSGLTSFGVAKVMIDRGLLLRHQQNGTSVFRTRMAESVRLYSQLRQMFPKHARGDNWRTAPTLVSDYRFLRRQRKYPQRNLQAAEVLKQLDETAGFTPIHHLLLSALISHSSGMYSLARFQQDACKNVLRGVQQSRHRSTATIVCAGTGTGKTLAFYLPALTFIGNELVTKRKDAVKALAIYPRNELLKDQFIETLRQTRKLNGELAKKGVRKVRIAALFGMVPLNKDAIYRDYMKSAWSHHRDGMICQYIPCPTESCRGKMVWRTSDIENSIERLYCDSCSQTIEPDEVILTRKRMKVELPDILFTSTEMLNKQMGNPFLASLFGIGKNVVPPSMMLLDEVHTYSGVSGAQNGMLIRRWRHLSGATPHFVGLSATLEQATCFMASLTGLEERLVLEVSPTEDDMETEGAEYMLALRGDPASRSSLLSTTIQASMLTRRMLDNAAAPVSSGIYGTRTFVFTDDIDVINRLYFQLLDAEGRYSNGNVNANKEPLAMLRGDAPNNEKFTFGQQWPLAKMIGHTLDSADRSNVKRTSSQDAGVDHAADLIVATASLEVGFNDPSVGAVIQHKAPRDNAQFLQRKGRAGRQRTMRPWTVVVLSDYGRDRMAFQCYENLFEPVLKARQLPVGNSYVLRMQAAFATMDWLSSRNEYLNQYNRGIWDDLSVPQDKGKPSVAQAKLADLIEDLLNSQKTQQVFNTWLAEALGIKDNLLQSLLWQPPRAIMTAFLPTVLRRLRSNWSRLGVEQADNCRKSTPMPDFIPSALFNDLCLPELQINMPDEAGQEPDAHSMPILQGMKDFAPGRISKRFAIKSIRERHWVVPKNLDLKDGAHPFPIDDYCPPDKRELMPDGYITTRSGMRAIPCFRAWEVTASMPPDDFKLSETSNAFLAWHSEIRPPQSGIPAEVPSNNVWQNIFQQVEFYSHQQHCPIEVVRFATGSRANIKFSDQREDLQIDFKFEHEGGPAAFGFSLWVDAVKFQCRLPNFDLASISNNRELMAGLRTARFLYEVSHDEAISVNPFLGGWLAETVLAGIGSEAVLKKCTPEQAFHALQHNSAGIALIDVPACIFQTLYDAQTGAEVEQDLQQSLRELLSQAPVMAKIEDWVELLWQPLDSSWLEWLTLNFINTLGAALLQTAMQLCPDADDNDLILDLNGGPVRSALLAPDQHEIWLSETTVGGGGILEKIQQIYREDPRCFFELLDFNLSSGDYETMDNNVWHLLQTLGSPSSALPMCISAMRSASTHASQVQAQRGLLSELQRSGFMTSHSFLSAINTRLLRPGTDASSDAFLLQLHQEWRREEQRLGIELPQRVYAFTCSQSSALDRQLPQASHGQHNLESWRFNTCNGLLWPRGHTIRDAWLTWYNPYSFAGPTERLLLAHIVQHSCAQVPLSQPNWMQECHQHLENKGKCELLAKPGDVLNEAIATLLVTPVEMYGLFFYPRVSALRRHNNDTFAMIDIPEAIQ
ncbi:ATP-dependent helicase [Yersinia thracica]|jgi:ATP-dependent Lhr-like helicase|uniref:ATP-dependent helicase n=1 Tax=Yersinia thracica TaxID=2890319 RepID=A0A0T9PRT8_9GAMM|nr:MULTISPECIES: protein DpdJ [Yersinia]ATM88536.1 DEAD/DEAH box helicase [Yersinia frederiksenii]EKN4770863.1 DEAD/DEAH box helicase [Yersinia enterocolitica]CNH79272.1 ATP-dependent helicase [Yersinia thracica]